MTISVLSTLYWFYYHWSGVFAFAFGYWWNSLSVGSHGMTSILGQHGIVDIVGHRTRQQSHIHYTSHEYIRDVHS